MGARIDLKNLQVATEWGNVDCVKENGESLICRVSSAETTTIPAGHEAIIMGTIDKKFKSNKIGIVEAEDAKYQLAKKGLIVARTLVETGELVPVRVFNPSASNKVIRKNTRLGTLSVVDKEEIENQPTYSCERYREVPEHLKDLLARSTKDLPENYHENVVELLTEFQDIFVKHDGDLGRTNLVEHHIDTGRQRPIRQRPRKHPLGQREEIKEQVSKMLDKGIIEPTDSPWASNVVLVRKKDGSQRFCVDYRQLNAVTIKDAYPLPRIDETLDALSGAKWFSTLDLASGYWQVGLDKDAKAKSAFLADGGLYAWNVMPFGLCNAPATFERLMDKVLAGLQWEILLVYLDDLIIFGKSIPEEITRLRQVFQRLRQANLKLKASKCHLFRTQVSYLGHEVSSEGVSTQQDKIEAIRTWPTPTNVSEVRSFLGLASYYRRFVEGFARIAKPLHQLTEKGHAGQFGWSSVCQAAFDELKQRLMCAPILAYPNPEGEFILDTDASKDGIGGVLSQVQNGHERVIAYGSKVLSKAERNYCVTRRELLAVVTYLKHFRQYLYGRHVTVRTDHGALRWLTNFKQPEGQLARWLEVISEYDIEIVHRAGRSHANADALSRKPCRQCGKADTEEWSGQDLEKLNGEQDVLGSPDTSVKSEDVIGRNHIELENCDGRVNMLQFTDSSFMDKLKTNQRNDQNLRVIVDAVENGQKPSREELSALPSSVKVLLGHWDQLEVRDGILYRKWESNDGKRTNWRIVLPREMRNEILGELHSAPTAGHLGMNKTLSKVRHRFYWVGMRTDIRSFIRQCPTCNRNKPGGRKRRAPLQQRMCGGPMERIALDIMGPLPTTDNGNKYVLVIADYFTKFVEAYAIPNEKAETVSQKLVDEFICRYGIPEEIHTDQGRNFESKIFQNVCQLLGIRKTRTTAYNPKSDGMVERFNRTLVSILVTMLEPEKHQKDWDKYLPMVTSAYRSTVHETTKETPNMMMFGREVTLPIDVMYKEPKDDEDKDYTQELRERLDRTYERVREQGQTELRRQKRNYDKRSHGKLYEVGNFVWLRNNTRKKGLNPKLFSKWTGPYKIISRLSDVTYRIQLSPRTKPSVVHFDRLKPCEGSEPYVWNRHETQQPLDEPNTDETSDENNNDDPNNQDHEDHTEQNRRYPQRRRRPPNYFY